MTVPRLVRCGNPGQGLEAWYTIAAMRFLAVLAVGLLACNTPVRPERSTEGASSASGDAATPPPRPSATAPAAPAGKMALSSGATLDLPPGAVEADAPSSLPSEVKLARVYKLPDESRLMVNEFHRGSEPCAAALEREWSKMQAARGDTDPERLKYRRVEDVERVDLDGKQAVYGASTHGTGKPGEVATLATLVFCAGEDHVVAMLAAKQATTPADTRARLLGLARSHRAR